MKIGILITGHPPEELSDRGGYDTYFERLLDGHGFTFQGWPVVDGVFPSSVEDADGWLITGSRHGAYEPHDWIPPLEDFIRQAYAAAIPMVGICFGHQIIAQAMGGKVEKFDKGWSVGLTDYEMNGRSYVINAWHQDQVIGVPEGAQVFARTDFCKYAGLLYGDRIWTLQPHPEYSSDFIGGLIETRGKDAVPETLLAEAKAKLAHPSDAMEVAQIMVDFFRKERA
ncbi:MAG: type 1 glutamine amidotransferase [Pseudomonadota bacterium]